MKTALRLLLVLLAKSGSAETLVPYTPDSLQKGDYLTIESVFYYPYIAPGLEEELPWRAENIRRVILRATVTDEDSDALNIDFTLENLYDCRNDNEKPDFYYFDSALDYLLKPIDPEELIHAVNKAVRITLRKQDNKQMQNLLTNAKTIDKQKKIALSVADKIEFVEIGTIIRCESESNYTTFFLKSGEKLIVSRTLKEFDELLTPYHFLRVHQSHLINLDEIKSFIKTDGGYIRMKDGSPVSISRQRRNYVMEILKQL